MRAFDDRGQVFTMEGIVAALIIVFSVLFITNSINLVSPQTENAAVAKLEVKAQDTLEVLNSVDQPSNFSSVLHRDIAAWKGGEGSVDDPVDTGESSIIDLDQKIGYALSVTSPDIMYNYNLEIVYWNGDTDTFDKKTLIYHGDAQSLTYNAVSGKKKIVLNNGDIMGSTDSFWKDEEMPRVIEVVLVMWSV